MTMKSIIGAGRGFVVVLFAVFFVKLFVAVCVLFALSQRTLSPSVCI